ncbi:hypothetical protein ACFFRE_11410 [Aciditerrimonas ferrireducens]|uniref:Uncharacterized protein n=1 Tax=Aciditerrimonas ferrireducens TaxID=667306 RepID=A0ABV6C8W3_9ACTN
MGALEGTGAGPGVALGFGPAGVPPLAGAGRVGEAVGVVAPGPWLADGPAAGSALATLGWVVAGDVGKGLLRAASVPPVAGLAAPGSAPAATLADPFGGPAGVP